MCATSTNGASGRTVKLPTGKILIPGVITHHTTTVEHPQLVAERIVQLRRGSSGRENVIAGTDCGFAQGETIQRVHPQVMWAKFESLAEGARLASAIVGRAHWAVRRIGGGVRSECERS